MRCRAVLRFAPCSRAPRGFVLKEHKEEVSLPPLHPRVPPERARADAQRTHKARAAHRETCRRSFWTRSRPSPPRSPHSEPFGTQVELLDSLRSGELQNRALASDLLCRPAPALGRSGDRTLPLYKTGLNPPLSPRECRLLLDSRRPPGRTVNDWSDVVQVSPAPPSCARALPRGHAIKFCPLQGASLPAAWGEVGSPGWGIIALRAVDGVSGASM